MHAYSTTPPRTDATIAAALRALTGADDAAAQQAAQTECRTWNHARDALASARANGGPQAAQRALAALQRNYQELTRLLAAAPGGRTKAKRNAGAKGARTRTAPDPSAAQSPSPSAWLIEYAKQHAEFFHAPDGEPYAAAVINGIRTTIPLADRSKVRSWLSRAYYDAHGKPPSRPAFDGAIDVLSSYASYDGERRPVWLRIAYESDPARLYIDLGDERWRAIEIDSSGWRVVDAPPVIFRRGKGMKPLPEPERGGSLHDLRQAFGIGVSDADWLLLCGWLLGAVRPPGAGAVPALALQAEPGSGKTWLAQALRRIVDDHEAVQGSNPRSEEEIVIEAHHAHIITFDNLTRINQDTSDLLCRMATGGAFVKRKLYTDDDARCVTFKRPVILTSVADIVTAGDLLDRTIVVRLNRITQYRSESDLDAAFRRFHPRLLGALCDAISVGLRNYDATPTPNVRMADLARWVEACAPALGWKPGAFTEALSIARAESARLALESDPITQEIERLLDKDPVWEGTPSDLYQRMEQSLHMTTNGRTPNWWPGNSASLMRRLQKLSPDLRRIGIEVTPSRQCRMPDGTKKKIMRIERVPPEPDAPQPPPTPGKAGAAPAPAHRQSSPPAVTPISPCHTHPENGCDSDSGHSDAPVTDVTDVTPIFLHLSHGSGADARGPLHSGAVNGASETHCESVQCTDHAPPPEAPPAPPNGVPPVPDGVKPEAWARVNWKHIRQMIERKPARWDAAVRTHLALRLGKTPAETLDAILAYFAQEGCDGG